MHLLNVHLSVQFLVWEPHDKVICPFQNVLIFRDDFYYFKYSPIHRLFYMPLFDFSGIVAFSCVFHIASPSLFCHINNTKNTIARFLVPIIANICSHFNYILLVLFYSACLLLSFSWWISYILSRQKIQLYFCLFDLSKSFL